MAAPTVTCRKYLIQFAHEHLDLRIPELLAVGRLFDTKLTLPADYDEKSPYLVIDLPSEDIAKKIASRTILIRSLYELWAQAADYKSLFHRLGQLPHQWVSSYLPENGSFRLRHDSFNKQLLQSEKVELYERVLGESGLAFPGTINLSTPDQSFHIMEYYGRQDVTQAPDVPEMLYFARWVTDGHRNAVTKYDLKKRKFIGNTSMDAALALIMSNMGLVDRNKIICDPFVGTGSLLIAGAHYGAYVMGTEIDWRLLHGRGRSSRADQKWRSHDENIRNSLRQYDLGDLYLDVMVADASKQNLWKHTEIFDAIITDPPYGIREPTKKVGTDKDAVTIEDKHKDGHIPSKVTYELSQILLDLVNFAAKFLRLDGHLVYWLPVYRDDYVEENVPRHPCLELVANSEQVLNIKVARRLITMKKVVPYKTELQLAELPSNHYKDAPFREKYFRSLDKGPRDQKPTNTRQRKKRKAGNKSQNQSHDQSKSCDQSQSSDQSKSCDLSQSCDQTNLTCEVDGAVHDCVLTDKTEASEPNVTDLNNTVNNLTIMDDSSGNS